MFTGIVQGMVIVTRIDRKDDVCSVEVDLDTLSHDLERGASVSVAGVCLTAVAVRGSMVRFDIILETMRRTNLDSLSIGDAVNVERAVRVGDEVGGHSVSGHVTGCALVRRVDLSGHERILTFVCDKSFMPYIFPQGFMALNGCSLTVVTVGDDWFTVHLIPETIACTTFGRVSAGDRVNLEIDSTTRVIVDTVQRYLFQIHTV